MKEDILICSKNPGNGDYTASLGYSTRFLEEQGEACWW
jgi:hypothetical protein